MAYAKYLLAASLAGVLACASSLAHAQTLAQSGVLYPDRIVDGVDLGSSTRPQNLNPNGISYTDCTSDMTLRFTVALSGFTGADDIQVWASLSSDCTATTDRGHGGGTTAEVCWGVGISNWQVEPIINTTTTQTFDIRVQDIVGWQQVLPLISQAADPPRQGIAACSAQPTFAAVSININFLAINASSGASDGSPYQYTISTDMVGPPPPSGVGESAGDTLMNITWTPNTDSDTAGYAVYMDPPPGQENAETGATLDSGATLVCPAGTGTGVDADVDAGDGAALDATPSVVDASCYMVVTGSSSQGTVGGQCSNATNDPALEGSIVADGGAEGGTTVVQPVFDEAGDLLSEGGVEEGTGGISTVGSQFQITELTDKSASHYQVKGLVNGVQYHMVVSSIDGTGNVGPPSTQVCDYPAPVRDFWDAYREDGGAANGFCALQAVGASGTSLAGVTAVLVSAAIARRRRRTGAGGERRP